ncbi:hypothetical protein [Thalassococcus sp. S3]|uniref:hypothetical protein n=1 Tax=Thalassococcus sp. S3 TaxID=2017482 RepID=UPI0010242545|nr:hypothetical protein [Thalassococcus sp. S3]QBF31386.1 hypothetical protein CFI11_09155 [Thalassococcus sp. S3]
MNTASQDKGGATSDRVAGFATVEDQIDLSGTIVLGVFGANTDLTALVRLRSGRVRRVRRGMRLSGSDVAGIDSDGIVLHRHGRISRLSLR